MDKLLEVLVKKLADLGITERWPDDGFRVFARCVNYREEGDIYFVARTYKADTYINIWVDKLLLKTGETQFPDMGNGFIHVSLRNPGDVDQIVKIIEMAVR